MKPNEIKHLFDNFNSKRILIIGDVMIDAYLWGKVERISPEAPVPVVSVTKRENRLGGAANVGLNIKSLGAEAILCAVIGEDEKATLFFDLLKEQNLVSEGILTDSSRKTTVKSRVISHGQHLLRVDDEMDHELSPATEKKFIAHVSKLIQNQKIDALIFEDYDKGCITPHVIQKIVALASKKNIPTLVDPKKRNFLSYQGVTLFKPNFKELIEGLKIEIKKNDLNGLEKASKELKKHLNNRYTMITLSEYGMFIGEERSSHHIPAVVRDIADVSGAGDTVISVTSLCLAAGTTARDAAIIANVAGGLVCEKVGVVPIDKIQLMTECIKYYKS